MASLGTWPAWLGVSACRFDMRVNQRANSAPNDSSEQVVDLLNDRWMVYVTLHARFHRDAAAIEAFLNSFRGQVNTVNLWHFTRPAPRGTLRGTLLTSGAQAQGAASLVLSGGTNGQTVLAGDMVGSGGQLLMASADAVVSAGLITIPLVNRLRAAIASGQSATWDKPTAPFRLLSHSGVTYIPGSAEEVTMTLGEAI